MPAQRERQFVGNIDKMVPLRWWHFSPPPKCGRTRRVPIPSCIFAIFLVSAGQSCIIAIFFDSVCFDRILELDEQTGVHEEVFKIFLKMVPFAPRFFSYQ